MSKPCARNWFEMQEPARQVRTLAGPVVKRVTLREPMGDQTTAWSEGEEKSAPQTCKRVRKGNASHLIVTM
jgi:hypothetical protein